MRSTIMVFVWVSVALVLGGGVGMVVAKRLRTGEWQMVGQHDLVEVRDRVLGDERPTSRVIWLDRSAREVAPGDDDAARGRSSVVRHQGELARRLPGWKGSQKAWAQTVKCVKDVFAPFAVEITETRPATDEFILVAVGGRPSDIGVKDRRVAGLAPFSGGIIPRAVVFSFAAAQGHQPQAVCETIAMEVAHAYGLDHEYLCSDVMTYLRPCGKRRFVDKPAPCGEKKPRPCAGTGAAQQNSYRRMAEAVGLRPKPPAGAGK